MKWSVLMMITVAAALFVSGCNKDIKDYCDGKVKCEGGNDADYDACVDGFKGEQDVADDYDCGDIFDVLIQCMAAESSCENDYYTSGSKCSDIEKDYGECISDGSGY